MASVTARDLKIFEFLVDGPATVDQIQAHLYKNLYQLDRNKLKKVIYERLSKLIRSNYIQAKHYVNRNGSGRYALYSLTEFSSEILVREKNYSIETIRCTLPAPFHVTHELEVTGIIRAIKKENCRSNYEVKIMDENALKATAITRNVFKAYSDLTLAITFPSGKTVHITVEMDNGSFLAKDMIEKVCHICMPFVHQKVPKDTPQDILNRMAKAARPVIIVCTEQLRINALKLAFKRKYDPLNLALQSKDGKEYQILSRHLFLVPLYDISSRGLFGCTLTNINGANAKITQTGIIRA